MKNKKSWGMTVIAAVMLALVSSPILACGDGKAKHCHCAKKSHCTPGKKCQNAKAS